MKQPCGCCSGLEVVTPQSESNRPGLQALAYRAGTYATFLESMLARISSIYLDVPLADNSGNLQRIFPLNGLVLKDGKFVRVSPGLSTRELNDPSIVLLDAWAIVADVLTFYEERIANEGYLRTATEHRSILELARLVGYRLRPGISSSVYLAYTVSAGFNGIIPAGTRAQSLPGVGQMPQPFEISTDLPARDTWNNLQPRLTRPQVITLAANPDSGSTLTIDQGTDAATRDTIYFKGISTNLKTGDALLIAAGDSPGQQVLRFVESVNPQPSIPVSGQPDKSRTEVILQQPPPEVHWSGAGSNTQNAVAALQSVLTPYIVDADTIFPDGDLAHQVAAILVQLISDAKALADSSTSTSPADIAGLILPVLPEVNEKHDIATRRGFSRLEPWISDIDSALTTLVEKLPDFADTDFPQPPSSPAITSAAQFVPPGLGNLSSIVDRLSLLPSLQPANTFRLARNYRQVFAAKSDTAPRLVAAFHPRASSSLYKAWAGIQPQGGPVQVFAMRVKSSLYGNNAPTPLRLDESGKVVTPINDWPVSENETRVDLESGFDKIVPNSWIVVQTADTTVTTAKTIFAKSKAPTLMSRGDYGMSGKITRISLANPLDPTYGVAWYAPGSSGAKNTPPGDDFDAIRQTLVYAQPEALDLAEEPLDRDVAGNTIELDGLYDGLESGKWIIVSGQRTDITDASGSTNATGLVGNELVMIAQVTQGAGKQSCVPLTVSAIPFAAVYSVAGPNAAGDLLIVGQPNTGFLDFLKGLPLPNLAGGNQQICDPIQIAPGLYANAYLPTAIERGGDFSTFGVGIIDPLGDGTQTFPGGVIPITRISGAAGSSGSVFAWRIASLASGDDTLHTNLVLANSLAYTYDSSTVTLYGNVAKATHGQTQGEVLGDGDASQALQTFALHQSPLTYLPAPTPSGAASTLVVRVNEVAWQESENLFVLGPSDREFITQTDDENNTTVTFGDGQHGLRIPSGTANVKAVYRSGTGQVGNVDALQISQLATRPLGVMSVLNPLPAAGGADGDTRDQARRNIPIGLTALDRLVSVQDYADFARRFAGIGKASSTRLTDGRRLLVHLTIAGKDDIPIDPTTDLYRALVMALADAGDPNQPIQIDLRRLKLLVIVAGVKIQPASTWEAVAASLRATLLALYSFDNRELGQSAFLSEAVSAMQAVPGVQYIDMQKFDAVAEPVTAAELAALATKLALNSFVQAELAHTDPKLGILPAELITLTPDIPDTLILTEITS